MTVVVGYLPTPEGSAAVDHAMEEARLTSSRVVVVNTGHYGDFSHPNYATAEDIEALEAQLTAAGLEHEILRSLESTSAGLGRGRARPRTTGPRRGRPGYGPRRGSGSARHQRDTREAEQSE